MPDRAGDHSAGPPLAGLAALREPALFGAIGVLNTAIDFLLFVLLVHFGVPPLLANAVSFSTGAANSYFLNARLTFRVGRKDRSRGTALRFAGMIASTLALSQAILWIGLRLALPPALAKLLSLLITFLFGFLVSKLFVFAPRAAR